MTTVFCDHLVFSFKAFFESRARQWCFRKGTLFSRSLLAVVVLLLSVRTDAKANPDPIQPLSPQELLKILPSAPEGWKMNVSNARNSFADWLSAMAIREFEFVVPAQSGNATKAPSQTARVMVSDGGYAPPIGAAFRNFSVGKQGNVEKTMFEGFPAIYFAAKEYESLRLMLWIKNRFFVLIETTGQKRDDLEAWACRINLAGLRAIPEEGSPLPNPVQIVRIDEINRANERSYHLNWSRAGSD